MTKDAYLEGREHIPSGCAISSIFSRSGKAVCGEKISFDEDTLTEGSIECPNCGEKLEFDLGDDDKDEDNE